MSERLAFAIRRLRWPLLVVWLAALIAAGIVAVPLPDRLSGGGWYVPGSESRAVAQALTSGFADRGATNLTLVVHDERYFAGTTEFEQRIGRVMREVGDDRRLQVVGSYGWDSLSRDARARFVGTDNRTAITLLALRLDDGTARRELPEVQEDLAERYESQGLRVAVIGAASLWGEVNMLSAEGLTRAELIAFPLILLILLMLYRGVVASIVSFVVGGTAIVLTFGILALIAQRYELSVFVQNAATMIGLGVSVDYSLFMISRYKEELSQGRDRGTALASTLRTSGEAVTLSGVIVILAMSSMFLVDLNIIQSIALGIIVVVSFALIASVLILPAVLYLLGNRIMAGKLPGRKEPAEVGDYWKRMAKQIMGRPVLVLAVSVTAMVALAAPVLGMRTFTPDARIVPESSPVRFGFDTINEQFGQGTASSMQVVIQLRAPLTESESAGADSVLALHDRLVELQDVTRVDSAVETLRAANLDRPFAALAPAAFSRLPADAQKTVNHFVSTDRRKVVLEVIPDDYASGERARDLLTSVRAAAQQVSGPGVTTAVGGETAEGVDANNVIQDGLPAVVLVMLGVIYLLLLITFRSLLLPLKAILLNLLSVGATFGVLVLVFQHGIGADLLGYEEVGYIQNFVPVLLLAILFSLSTDYEVFLLNRVREEYNAGADNSDSVANGLARTAPLISGAAVLMIAVFGAFAFTSIMPIQQLGFGLAVAIALDATIIRLVVVPATMQLMGRWNWWLPGRRSDRHDAAPAVEPVPVQESSNLGYHTEKGTQL